MNRSIVIWSAVRNWGQRLGAVLTFFVLVRLLPQDQIAIFAAAAAVMALLDLFTDNGLGDAIVQAKEAPERISTAILLINIGIASLLCIGVQIFAEQISGFLGVGGAENVLRVAAFALVLNGIGFVPQALMRKDFQYKRLAMRSLAATIISAAVGTVMALTGFGVWSMVGQFVVVGVVNAFMAWYPPVLTLVQPSFAETGPLIKFGSRIFATRILYYLSSRVMEILLPVLFGPTALALYFMSVRLPAVLGQLLVTVVTDLGLPTFSKLADDPKALSNAFFSSLVFAAGISIPAFVFLGALAPEITSLAFGENGRGSEYLLLPLAIYSALQSVGSYNQIILNARGMSGVSLWLSLANAVLMMAVFFFARNTNVYVFTYAYAAAQCAFIPVYFYIGGLYSGISFRKLVIVTYPYFLAAAVALGAVYLVRPLISQSLSELSSPALVHDFIKAVILTPLYMVIYLTGLFLLDRKALMMIVRQFMLRRKKAA